MPRRKRYDHAGCLHHVMNRGLARRTIFETRTDARRFLAILSCAVRAGRIEVHAYSLMLTHFHLLVRSVDGNLSESMRLVQNSYVRWFNRSRRRDGPLMRGRFLSVPVMSTRYARTLVRYIDQNPVQARVVSRPYEYPFGSARFHRGENRIRKGLERSLIDGLMAEFIPCIEDRASTYDTIFAPRLDAEQRAWIERRLERGASPTDDLDQLLPASTAGVRAWALRKARLADGTDPGLALVSPLSIVRIMRGELDRGEWKLRVAGFHAKDGWEVAHAALLRDLAGESHAAIARQLGRSPAYPGKLLQVHAGAMTEDASYAERYARLTRQCLNRVHATETKW